MHVRLFSDIGHAMPKIDWEGMCSLSRRKLKCACWSLKICVVATAGTVTDTYFELKILCLFYIVLKSENTGIISRLQWYMRNNSIFPFYTLSFFVSIPNVN